jgi:hypothetical protein
MDLLEVFDCSAGIWDKSAVEVKTQFEPHKGL